VTENLHLSDLELDGMAFEPSPTSPADRASHLASCARCQAALSEIREGRESFARERLARTLPQVRARVRRRWNPISILVPALSLGLLLAIALPRLHAPSARPLADLGIKSGAAMRVVARRGDQTFAVEAGARLREGDLVRFEIEGAGWPFLLVASIDGEGKAVVLYPYQGDGSMPFDSAYRMILPGSIVLDAAPGPERVFALLSREPLKSAPVLAALERLGAQGSETVRTQSTLDVPGVGRQLSLFWDKEPSNSAPGSVP
jgi:hypothetical protein